MDFERKALDRKLREDEHTCIDLCRPAQGEHYRWSEPIARPYRVGWGDRIMVVLDWMGEISL